jgi:hypothetical protein
LRLNHIYILLNSNSINKLQKTSYRNFSYNNYTKDSIAISHIARQLSEAHRFAFNNTNFLEDGYTKESVFKIDGKEYKLNENGKLNIPEGIICLAETIQITN